MEPTALHQPSRRRLIAIAASGLVATLVGGGRAGPLIGRPSSQERPPPLNPELAHEFVSAAHSDLEATRALYSHYPRLIYATWDWGGGDWETALGGAAHMGRKDIAGFLLESGARLDLFCAAMLGMRTVVQGVLTSFPDAVHWHGPHGFSLLRHARAGGPENEPLVEFLEEHAATRPKPTTWTDTLRTDG